MASLVSHAGDSEDEGDALLTDGCCGEILIPKTNHSHCQIGVCVCDNVQFVSEILNFFGNGP